MVKMNWYQLGKIMFWGWNPALQVRSPEFKPHSHQKKEEEEK
jgi:hypothetical protein